MKIDMEKERILIIDDDRAVCSSIALLLKRSSFTVDYVYYPKDVMQKLISFTPGLVILDMNFSIETSGKKGMEVLQLIKKHDSSISVILMTGWATIQLAVKGMKAGAIDFIAKPWDNKQLLSSVKTAFTLNTKTKVASSYKNSFGNIIGSSSKLLEVLHMAQKISKTNASVLICGDSGTGKELLAEAIHYESERAHHSFVKVNLGGLSSSLFESELFGHKKGAFTDAYEDRIGRFEKAEGGTIFLDEIGELNLESQVKLLRVLQEKTYEVLGSSDSRKADVRIICATNKNLEEMVKEGSFREDLYYRINLITLRVPALKDRKSDIPLLLDFFINNLRLTYDKPNLSVTSEASEWLKKQYFSGNIRQLKNLIERTVLMSNSNTLVQEDFEKQHVHNALDPTYETLPAIGDLSLEEVEIKMIKKAMDYHQNSISKAARSLGITRNALYRRISKYNITNEPKN